MRNYFKDFGPLILILILIIYAPALNALSLKGTPHDLSGNGQMNRMCGSCHVPSSGNSKNKLLSQNANQTGTQSQQMLGLSSTIFCAQCHDGTISLRNIGGDQGSFGNNVNTIGKKGQDINTGGHPVNIGYPHSKTGFKSSPIERLKLYGPNNNQVKCITCHDPHEVGGANSLRIKNNICVGCHDK
ncbi:MULTISPECIES: cytochrome c3 family protein [unclassified Candidatus Frackibacter]|uniref:cytochrome c3 family protein n=1 Tax=unclassified Candidatus Frackibacter TaxID=2648818 RepID=UPI00088F46FC|nr:MULTISPECIES: cytochrome c3 family protein [unclassified Candidatus Frackibacter]SDC12176.1 doubled CXXCH domain-containing protein [Candidatus Frackibacter sp. WG11]SEM35984.1 doubled CXXCH domain-containing protein [Candidatus Frackibacter sp. WG12]SFL41233.1 doubled CXXCH domain-containing protein [Candidatus Frackibacter sp. WG13]